MNAAPPSGACVMDKRPQPASVAYSPASGRAGAGAIPCVGTTAGVAVVVGGDWDAREPGSAQPARQLPASSTHATPRPDFDRTSICRVPSDSKRQNRSEEHTSELQSLMRLSYAVFCLNKKTTI